MTSDRVMEIRMEALLDSLTEHGYSENQAVDIVNTVAEYTVHLWQEINKEKENEQAEQQ
jgi:hypothetical protein